MKFSHTNTMKDDDKPEAPEGYTAMLGKDVSTRIGLKFFYSATNLWVNCVEGFPLRRDDWYAVPNTEEEDLRPKAPEGYTAMLGKDVPRNAPADGLMAWCKMAWMPTEYSAQSCYPNNHYPDDWFAVPVSGHACTVIRDMAMKEKWTADPKASQAVQKPQLQLIPPALNEETAKALMRGAKKYGFFNWRENKVEMMTYLGAMKRHIDCLIEGEDIDPDTGAHHLGCVAAGCGIVLDARKHGTLVDNRPPKGQIN